MVINHNSDTGTEKNVSANYPTLANYRITVDEPTECVLTHLNSPLGKEETIRFACYDVDNVYKNTGIRAMEQQVTGSGVKVVCSVKQTWSVDAESTDSAAAPAYKLPVTAQFSLTIPKNEYIKTTDLQQLFEDMVGLIYGADGAERLSSLIRGGLRP